MELEAKKILQEYQSEYVRSREESFVQMFTERDDVRLFFINENRAFTDGKNIVVDPAMDEIFVDKQALALTEQWMNIPALFSKDSVAAIQMMTRSQEIHEALHILYSKFPLYALHDKRSTNKFRRQLLALIANIIEDAYIEAVGCSEYDNLEFYLVFGRISRVFACCHGPGTVEQVFGKIEVKNPVQSTEIITDTIKLQCIKAYLEYMSGYLLYPMLEQGEPDSLIKFYVEQSKELFKNGSICSDSKERHSYAQRIFDLLEPLIPETEEMIDMHIMDSMIVGVKTHSTDNAAFAIQENEPHLGHITRRLFYTLDDEKIKDNDYVVALSEFANDVEIVKMNKMISNQLQSRIISISGNMYDCSKMHESITIIEKKPKVNLNLKKAYENIYKKYRLSVDVYSRCFEQIFKIDTPVRINKQFFGTGIDSRRFADIKKRYWYQNDIEPDLPDLGIILMIDGSGSMYGELVEGARDACIVLHEVLKKYHIDHAIVEHRAIYEEPMLNHNILVDFNAKNEEKYNILSLSASEGTREGLSLYWAENYLKKNCSAENKLIMMISDGIPAHGLDGPACYLPPVSIKDTENAVRKIRKRGTDIIAIALDDEEYDCYDMLKEMYPDVIACTDITQLAGQILRLIMKKLKY